MKLCVREVVGSVEDAVQHHECCWIGPFRPRMGANEPDQPVLVRQEFVAMPAVPSIHYLASVLL